MNNAKVYQLFELHTEIKQTGINIENCVWRNAIWFVYSQICIPVQ